MSAPIAITAFGYFDEAGFGGTSHGGALSHPISLDTLKWSDVSDIAFRRFGQLDALSKCAMVAVEMLGLPKGGDPALPSNTAISMGTQEGCLGADIDFAAGMAGEAGPSPRLFTYTLPSVASGEIAIRHGFQGSNACFLAGAESGLLAFWEGYYLVLNGEADACLCIECDALSPSAAPIAAEKSLTEGRAACKARTFFFEHDGRAMASGRSPLAFLERGTSVPSEAEEGLASLDDLKTFLDGAPEDNAAVCRLPSPKATGANETLVVTRRKL